MVHLRVRVRVRVRVSPRASEASKWRFYCVEKVG